MKTTNLGYPRIGQKRELKKACEQYWAKKIDLDTLKNQGQIIRKQNWKLQQQIGIDIIPSNDFSFYDQVLDTSLLFKCIPSRYKALIDKNIAKEDLYFAMARGYQNDNIDVTAMEMTKWFDTNYHYIVPEFEKEQNFELDSSKIINEYLEAQSIGIKTKPVVIGPVSFLLLGKEKENGFHRIELIDRLLPLYLNLISELKNLGVTHIQFDEPYLSMDLSKVEQKALQNAYETIHKHSPSTNITLANYFDCYGANLDIALSLPVQTLHLDLVRCPSQLDDVLKSNQLNPTTSLSLGIVDGRNIWKNDFESSLKTIDEAIKELGNDRIVLAPSCSLLHSPCNLELEKSIEPEIRNWLAFAQQKLTEIVSLKQLSLGENKIETKLALHNNIHAMESRRLSSLIHNNKVKERVAALTNKDSQRKNTFEIREGLQRKKLQLPLYPTTTIGSFPQSTEVRNWRLQFKKGTLSKEKYNELLEKETKDSILFQEEIDIDVLVHGEFERNDMVEYFGEKLNGFVFTNYGWVQSYGSRCVKPPIIFGDVDRPNPMTVKWSSFAQSLTKKPVKGMLTGPVTILQWSFVRNDQPRSITCNQIALAIRDEVTDLESAGLKIIQIDEPAIREGLPLRKQDWKQYLEWAVNAFKIASSSVENTTQIHTHMCYSEFNDIIEDIANMDADVITIECSRSQMELLDAFVSFNYPNQIGPGVYDIHSPRVPSTDEMILLLEKANHQIPAQRLWVNPDCGLKTRHWKETKQALIAMVKASKELRAAVPEVI